MKYSRDYSQQNNAIHLSRAAQIRKEIFYKHWRFTINFTDDCQDESILASLLSLIHRITGSSYDPNSKNKFTKNTLIHLLSFLQLIHLTHFRQRRNSRTPPHTSALEAPLSIDVAFLLHSQKRSNFLIDMFRDLILSISYDQMLVSLTQGANWAYTKLQSDGIICVAKICSNFFTIFSADNIDHNPSSRSAKNSCYGAAFSST